MGWMLFALAALVAVIGWTLFVAACRAGEKAKAAAAVAEAARLDAIEALGLAGEARRTQAASHAAEVERMCTTHGETIDALLRANERADAATAEADTARQWNASAARVHDVEVAGLKSDLTTARRTIDRLEDERDRARFAVNDIRQSVRGWLSFYPEIPEAAEET